TLTPSDSTEPAPVTPQPASQPEPPATAKTPLAATAPDAVPTLPRREPSRPRVEFGVGWSVAPYGIAPAFAMGATGSASLRWSRFALGAEGWIGLPASAPVSAFSDASVRTSLSGGGTTACFYFNDLFACGVALLGSLHIEAPGISGASTGRALELLG